MVKRKLASQRRCKNCSRTFQPRADLVSQGMGIFCGMECCAESKRGSKLSDSEIVAMYQTGLTMKQVAQKTGMGWKSVQRRVHAAGVAINPHKRAKAERPSTRGRKVYQWVAEKKYGRRTKKGECIHHLNLDCTDNDQSNLLMMGLRDHAKVHHQLQGVVSNLIKSGVIVFNEKKMRYENATDS